MGALISESLHPMWSVISWFHSESNLSSSCIFNQFLSYVNTTSWHESFISSDPTISDCFLISKISCLTSLVKSDLSGIWQRPNASLLIGLLSSKSTNTKFLVLRYSTVWLSYVISKICLWLKIGVRPTPLFEYWSDA